MNESIERFLKRYLENYELKFTTENAIRYLCENYIYSPDKPEFKWMALGYFMANGCDAEANTNADMLIREMDRVYKIVSDENGWHTWTEDDYVVSGAIKEYVEGPDERINRVAEEVKKDEEKFKNFMRRRQESRRKK